MGKTNPPNIWLLKTKGLNSYKQWDLEPKALIFFFMFLFYFLKRDRALAGEEQRERETQNLKQAPDSEVSAQSLTPGSNSLTVRS